MVNKVKIYSSFFILIFFLLLIITSCSSNEKEMAQKDYTIQYVDNYGVHKIVVRSGEAYSLEVIPEKNGYVFTGLFDAEVGGTQYVNANGSALSIFTDNKNLILFPQFKPKEYTIILDYQGANVTGSRSMKVEYESVIVELPMNLFLENKDFTGWYTEPNCEGKQIADKFGVIPAVNQIIEENFDLSNNKGYIYLYAGFKGKEYTVTFYAQDNNSPEEIKVEHGTSIVDVVPTTRVNGQAVLSWSKTKGGEPFTEKVTSDMTLYAVEYAPYIELDSNGGANINPIIARSGESVSLPTPTRKNYKFVEWQDSNGKKCEIDKMPSESVVLKAKWQSMICFDSNGGSEVNDISLNPGEIITLPTPTKEGFLFAGWYTNDKEKYENNKMPSISVELKAGWYKEKKLIKTFASEDNPIKLYYYNTSSTQIKMSDIDNSVDFTGKTYIRLDIYFKARHFDSGYGWGGYFNIQYGIYSKNQRSDTTRLFETKFYHENISSYQQRNCSTTIEIEDGQFFIIYNGCDLSGNGGPDIYIKDYYIILYYPDTTNLYL